MKIVNQFFIFDNIISLGKKQVKKFLKIKKNNYFCKILFKKHIRLISQNLGPQVGQRWSN